MHPWAVVAVIAKMPATRAAAKVRTMAPAGEGKVLVDPVRFIVPVQRC